MDCDVIRDLLPMYADGQASDASRRLIDEHTAACTACRRLRDKMCAPLEPEPVDEEQRGRDIMEALQKKQRRRTILRWVIPVLLVVLGWWIAMEVSFSGTLVSHTAVAEEKILAKVPELAVTDAELALADTIFQAELFREAMSGESSGFTSFTTPEARDLFSSVIPEDAEVIDIAAAQGYVFVSYLVGNTQTVVWYSDTDLTGHTDGITKTISISSNGWDGEANVTGCYEVFYPTPCGTPQYREYKSSHMWFSFLEMP